MSRAVRSSQPASDEFAAAVRWYEERCVGLGAEFLDAVTDTTALIQARPEIGSPVAHDPLTQRVLVRRCPYQVVYHVTPTQIVIVAVAHLKRRPGYWKNRT